MPDKWEQYASTDTSDKWEQYTSTDQTPALKPSHPPVDYNRLSMALVSSHMMGMSPGLAYDQHDTINSELTKRDPTMPTSTASIAGDIKAGLEGSIFGLAYRGQMPETVGTQGRLDKLVTGLTQMVADLPFYLAGSTIGGYAGAAFGSAIPAVGTTAGGIGGAAMGTFAIPEAIRESLTLGIQKGEIKNFRELMDRTLDTFYAGEKGALTGLVVGKAGEFTPSMGKLLGPASKMAESTAKIAQQAAALTILPNILEGKLPTADEFVNNAALMGTLGLVGHGVSLALPESKQALLDVYAKDGKTPKESSEKVAAQPAVKPDLPDGLKPAIRITAKDGSKQIVYGQENETHADLAERVTGTRPVTIEELNTTPREPRVGQTVYINRDINFSGFDPNSQVEKATYIGEASEAGFPDRYLLQRFDDEGNPAGKVAVVRHEFGLTDKETAASFIGSGQGPKSSPVNRVLSQPEIHTQEVIDRALEFKGQDAETDTPPEAPKSGRGFAMVKGDSVLAFMNRKQAKNWMKANEPEVHDLWKQDNPDDNAELHSADYYKARQRVAGRNVAEGENAYSAMTPENAQRIAAFREDLNRSRADVSDKRYAETLRTFVIGQKDLRTAIANNLRRSLQKLLPDEVYRKALTLMRDYKGDEQSLREMLDAINSGDVSRLQSRLDLLKNTDLDEGDIPAEVTKESVDRLKAIAPVIERALNPTETMKAADAEITKYATATFGEAKGLDIFDSSIPPDKYITHILREADAEAEGGVGRPKLATRTPYGEKRFYPTTIDAMIAGKVPRTMDATDAIAVYGDRHATAVATRLFATELKNSELGKWGTSGTVPKGWKKLGDGRLFEYHGTDENGKPYTTALYVPPDIADAMKPITERKVLFQSGAGKAFRNLQSRLKAAFVGLSIFHGNALTHSAINNMGFDVVKSVQGSINSPEFQRMTEQWSADGLITSRSRTPYDVYRGLEGTTAFDAPSRMDVVRNIYGIEKLNKLAEATTNLTFDIIQTKYKVTDAETKMAAWDAKNPEATDQQRFAARRSIAKEVNAVYGGLNWEAMGWGPNSVELLRAIMLAPDWTFSNVYSLKYAMPKALGGEGGNPGGKAARMFWFRSASNGLLLTQATSLLISGQLSKNPTQVYLGKDDKGKEMYSSWFFAGAPKDFVTQLNAWHRDGALTGTAEFLSYKLGPLIGTAPRLLVNKDWSGKPIIKKDQGFIEKSGREAMFAAGEILPAPFAAKTALQMITDPDKDYTYTDFLSGLAGAPVYHRQEGKSGTKTMGGKSKGFHLAGVK